MSDGHHRLTVSLAFSPQCAETGVESPSSSDHVLSKDEEDAPQVGIALLGYSTSPADLSRFIDGGVQPRIGDRLFGTRKTRDVADLGDQGGSGKLPHAKDGQKDLPGARGQLPSPADELLGEEPFLLLQKEQLPDEALKQGLPGRVRKPYGPAGQLLEPVGGEGEFPTPFGDGPPQSTGDGFLGGPA